MTGANVVKLDDRCVSLKRNVCNFTELAEASTGFPDSLRKGQHVYPDRAAIVGSRREWLHLCYPGEHQTLRTANIEKGDEEASCNCDERGIKPGDLPKF
mmetsp:Transcript_7478/g.10420  ORF Transcript_7478/g.10420 Transcript_7478/m.10420 type:complete len:99 (+) Transcript_7478:146-442(+)